MNRLARLIAAVTSRDHTGPAKDFKPDAEVILTSAFKHILEEPGAMNVGSKWWERSHNAPTDLPDAVDQMQTMYDDWAAMGLALGFPTHTDPEEMVERAQMLRERHEKATTIELRIDASELAGRLKSDTNVLIQVMGERAAQDAQWGGPDNDDKVNSEADWVSYIENQLGKLHRSWDLPDGQVPVVDEFRERMLKVAALAVAAIQSFDRVTGAAEPAPAPEPKQFRKAEFLALLDDAIDDGASFRSFSIHYWPGSIPRIPVHRIGERQNPFTSEGKDAVQRAHAAGREYLGDFHGAQYSVAIDNDYSITIEGSSR